MDNVLFHDHHDGMNYDYMSTAREKVLRHHASYSVEYISKMLGEYITRYHIGETDARRLQQAINFALDNNGVFMQEFALSGEFLIKPYHVRIYDEKGYKG